MKQFKIAVVNSSSFGKIFPQPSFLSTKMNYYSLRAMV